MQDEQIGELIADFIELIGFTKAELAKLYELQNQQRSEIQELQKAQNQLARVSKQQFNSNYSELNEKIVALREYFEQEQAKDKEFRDKFMAIVTVGNVVGIPLLILFFEKLIK